ncbi:MAG: hypothetical protein GX418_13965 [Clostridiales bacterium]|nr:hypothetical protein [Clostridiales bacterium]
MLWPAMILLVFELCFLLKQRFEELLPVAAGTAVLLCYVLAVFQALDWFPRIVYAAAAATLIWCLLLLTRGNAKRKLRAFLTNAFTPGLICFAAIVVMLGVAAAPHRVTHTDEVYVWAIQPASLFSHNGFVDWFQNLSPRFMTYTPGVHLFQWIGLSVRGEWAEGTLFLWLWLLYAVLLMPVTRRITWRQAWKIPLFALGIVLFPAVFNAEAYRILRVDTALGIALGYATVQAWRLARERERRGFLRFSLAVALSLLVLIKQPGIGWALLPPIIVLLAGSKVRGPKRSLREGALMLLPPAATFVSWLLVCRALGLTGQHLSLLAGTAEQVIGGQMPSAGDLSTVAGALLGAMATGSADAAAGGIHLPQLLWLLVFLLFPFILHRAGRMDRTVLKRLAGLMLGSYALYFLVFYLALFTAFRPEWTSPATPASIAPLLTNLSRYGCALWYALMMLYADLSLAPRTSEPREDVRPSARIAARALAVALTVAALLGLPWNVLRENLLPGRYPGCELTGELESLADNSFWTDSIDDPNAIVLLASDSYPYNRGWLQYALAPLKLVMPYETDLDADGVRAMLKNYRIGYFVSEGDANPLCQLAAEFTEDGWLDAYTVYAVRWEDDGVTLVSLE